MSDSHLSVERLFDDPPLIRALPNGIQYSADGDFVAFLRIAEDSRERLDLWRIDLTGDQPAATARCWVNAQRLTLTAGDLSDAEKAERERRRQFSGGITHFALSPDGRWALLCAGGAGHLLSIADDTIFQFTPHRTRQTDLRFSTTGAQLSYVRKGNLYRYDIASQQEHALTADGGTTVQYGSADFIAAEEMHRFDGHWWSPDDRLLAYTRVDEASVEVSRRFEIGADSFEVVEQRYPYAGERNAEVELLVQQIDTGTTAQLAYGDAPDDYLARVCWAGEHLAVQCQDRAQRSLALKLFDPRTGENERVLDEHSETWIELHNNFTPLDDGRFLWTSERTGSAQLYLYQGTNCRQLTRGPGRVNELLHTDADYAYYVGWHDSPTEQHLFCTALDPQQEQSQQEESQQEESQQASASQRLTIDSGWHEVTMAPDASTYIDRWSSSIEPGQLLLGRIGGPSKSLIRETVEQGHPYFPYLSKHTPSTFGTLEAVDVQILHYRLTEPSEMSGRHPVIVSVYGGPGVQRVRNEWAPLTLQLFSQRGFGVLELDNRGSSNRERRFQDPIHHRLGSVEVADQVTGTQFLARLPWVDASRIGVFGHSYGGYMALMCMANAPLTFHAGVAVAPVSDWRLYDTHYTERYLGTPQQNPDGYRASSVFPYLENLQGQLLLIHGMADDNVLFTHSTKLYAALQQANQHFEMMTYPGSKHALQEREVSVHRFNLILDFFDRALHASG